MILFQKFRKPGFRSSTAGGDHNPKTDIVVPVVLIVPVAVGTAGVVLVCIVPRATFPAVTAPELLGLRPQLSG